MTAAYLEPHERPYRHVDEIARLRAVNAELRGHLKEVADRFERCCIATGSAPEYAAQAVAIYRAAITRATA